MMTDDVAIRVENLGKLYRIGDKQEGYKTLRDTIVNSVRAPFRRFGSSLKHSSDDNTIWALKGVSFEVKRGEVVGVIGPNGAGKSTLLKILSRITEPTEGQVEIHGRVGSLLEVGTGFHPELTGRDNIFLNGAILGMRKVEIERKYDDIVTFAEIGKFIDTPVKHYSSGMYVRLGFAVAAHLEPEILLVDEVLAVGDYNFQKKCLNKIEDISAEGRTVFLVSHNLQSISNFCQRAILIREGTLGADGRTIDTIQSYLAMGSQTSNEVVWSDSSTAPGNGKLRLHSVHVLPEDGESTSYLDTSKEIIIQINYWCLTEGGKPILGFRLANQMGIFIFETHNSGRASLTPDEWSDRPHPVGLYQSECRLPACFLCEGTHSISVGTYETGLLAADLVSFSVHDSGLIPKPDGKAWGGVIRPRLAWSTKYLGNRL